MTNIASLLLLSLLPLSHACIGGGDEAGDATTKEPYNPASEPVTENLAPSATHSYLYDSSINAFEAAGRQISFQSKFNLACSPAIIEVDSHSAEHCTIKFDFIRTKLVKTGEPQTTRRQQRPSPGSGVVVEEESIVRELPKDRLEVAKEVEEAWHDLNSVAVQFTRLSNGSIFDILSTDRAGKDTVSVKRAIVFAFQTSFDKTQEEVLENDELGTHYTDYSYTDTTPGKVTIFKTVSPSDFVVSARRGVLRVTSSQTQSVDMWNRVVTSAAGLVKMLEKKTEERMQGSIVLPPKMGIEVVVSYNLTMVKSDESTTTENSVISESETTDDEVLPSTWKLDTSSDIAHLRAVDDSKALLEMFKIRAEKIGGIKGAIKLIEKFISNHRTTNLKLLRNVIHIEQILKHKGIEVEVIYRHVLPLIQAVTRKCEQRWGICIPLFEVLVLGGDSDAMILPYMENPQLDSHMQEKLANIIGTTSYPSERLLQSLLQLRRSTHLAARSPHLLLAIASVANKETIGVDLKLEVVQLLQDHGEPSPCTSSKSSHTALLALGNFLTRQVAEALLEETRLHVEWVDAVISCSTDPDHRLAALNSIHNLHHLKTVREIYEDVMRHGNCNEQTAIVNQLVFKLDKDDVWPAIGVNNVDTLIVAGWRKGNCMATAASAYVNTKIWPRRYFEVAAPRRVARQTEPFDTEPIVEMNCVDWKASDFFTLFKEEDYDFATDRYGETKQHCQFGVGIVAQVASLKWIGGIYAGKSAKGETGLVGKMFLGVEFVGAPINMVTFKFGRQTEQTSNLQWTYEDYTYLKLMEVVQFNEMNYECIPAVDDLSWGITYTTPMIKVTFSGFTFVMNGDFEARFNLTFYPVTCNADGGDLGIQLKPIAFAGMDAYAEMENDIFGIGTLATLYADYYLEATFGTPLACFFLHHGNNPMYFKFDFYLKLPAYVFVDYSPTPVILLQHYPILTWMFEIKKAGRYVIQGYCPNNGTMIPVGPSEVSWNIG